MANPQVDTEIVDEIRHAGKKRLEAFKKVDDPIKGFVLMSLSKRLRKKIVKSLSNEEMVTILNTLDPDKATDLLQELPKMRAEHLTKTLDIDIKEKVELLLSFNPKSAAGLMNLDYILATPKMHFEDISKDIEEHEKRTGKFPSILVVEDGKLVGELKGHTLALHSGKEKIDKYINRVPHVRYDNDEHKTKRRNNPAG